jgi:hypothetical protein
MSQQVLKHSLKGALARAMPHSVRWLSSDVSGRCSEQHSKRRSSP